ncbi:hypothetical protein [Halosimplex salinum]|uniref:hypothetical protein n=1 Tax=Halosimplex salinum TaxID=1710538 RepID=UPI000F4743A3|nr:hypothetical protein [Halosimplex salinum]
MKGEVRDRETAVELAKEYADEECVGQWGDVTDVRQTDGSWVVEFRTHTYSDEYEHRIEMNHVGNVFTHDRSGRLE